MPQDKRMVNIWELAVATTLLPVNSETLMMASFGFFWVFGPNCGWKWQRFIVGALEGSPMVHGGTLTSLVSLVKGWEQKWLPLFLKKK